jgi:hypothetical protein
MRAMKTAAGRRERRLPAQLKTGWSATTGYISGLLGQGNRLSEERNWSKILYCIEYSYLPIDNRQVAERECGPGGLKEQVQQSVNFLGLLSERYSRFQCIIAMAA